VDTPRLETGVFEMPRFRVPYLSPIEFEARRMLMTD
jgi:hypothetical protein